MGCFGSQEESNAASEVKPIQESGGTTEEVGLSGSGGNKETKQKHSRRNTSGKGITRLTMKFPHIRYSFRHCKQVFDTASGNDRDYISKAEVRPCLVDLGAKSSQLTDDEIDRIIQTANLDGDDQIDFKEFLIAAAVGCFLNDSMEQDNEEFNKIRKGFLVAKEAFDFVDADGSGEIDFEELKKAFSAMKADDLIAERLKELDFDGDKTIEFPEFVWGITAWVGMDPDNAEYDEDDFDDGNTEVNTGNVASPKRRLSTDDANNPNNPTDD